MCGMEPPPATGGGVTPPAPDRPSHADQDGDSSGPQPPPGGGGGGSSSVDQGARASSSGPSSSFTILVVVFCALATVTFLAFSCRLRARLRRQRLAGGGRGDGFHELGGISLQPVSTVDLDEGLVSPDAVILASTPRRLFNPCKYYVYRFRKEPANKSYTRTGG